MMKIALAITSFLLCLSSCNQKPELTKDSFVILESRNHGMFSILDDVISLLYAYQNNKISGAEMNFGTTGLYYDKKKGPNWFSYYFEPLKVGKETGKVVHLASLPYTEFLKPDEKIYAINHIEFAGVDKREVNSLIKKYIKIKPDVENVVNNFMQNNFVGYDMIGIHYRGTDKSSEAARTPYENVKSAVDDYVKDNNLKKFKVFIATDEQDFITYMQKNYSDICFQNAIRSTEGKPVHFNNEDPFRAGEEALTDMLLLSKTNYLIRTSSNLSRWSTYFNPDLKVLELSQRL